MTRLRAVFLMDLSSALRVKQQAKTAGLELQTEVVSNLSGLERAFDCHLDLLLSFGTSVIVPEQLLRSPNLIALNVHAASPNYPGRDPHHFAIYDGAKQYGATMHYMTPLVDAGQIVDVELFAVPAGIRPIQLLEMANQAALTLIDRLFQKMAVGEIILPMKGACWGTRKTTRKMFVDLCKVDGAMSVKEFNRRLLATSMPGYNNLYTEIHGHRFRLEN